VGADKELKKKSRGKRKVQKATKRGPLGQAKRRKKGCVAGLLIFEGRVTTGSMAVFMSSPSEKAGDKNSK